MKTPGQSYNYLIIIFLHMSMDHHPTSFFILDNGELGTFWIGQTKMRLDTNGRSLLPHISRDQLVDKLATKYEEYSYPCLEVERVKTDGTYLFYGLEQWITKLNCEIKRNPRKLRDVNELLTAGWIEGDPTINSTVHVLHINNTKEVVQKVYRKLLGEWEAKGLRCLNTLRCKTDKEKYEHKKQDPNFMYNKARKEIIRKIKKTGKMPKDATLEKYQIKEEEVNKIMGPTGIIYKITSPLGKVYVGQTIRSFEKRMKEHKRDSSRCTLIKRAIDKYGNEMVYEIIEEDVPQEHLDDREIYWIKELNSLAPDGYNCNTGGQFNVVTQEIKDKVRDGLNKSKINKDGYLGDVMQKGKLFYPRMRQQYNVIRLSEGGFQTREEAIDVLKEYTKNPENFTIVDNRRIRKEGSITKQSNGWRVSYKSTYLGTHKTELKAHEVLEKYLKDPENFPIVKKNVGNVVKRGDKWELKYKHRYIGTYDTENEAREAIEKYIRDPENFTKPEIQKKYGSVYPSKKRWALAYKGKYITSYDTEKEAQEALERYREDPDNFVKPKKKVGCVRPDKGRWKLTYKHKYIGTYGTQEEAEEALQSSIYTSSSEMA
jgi:predicted DNA-binding protein